MRLGLLFVVALAACGGKLVPTSDGVTDTGGGSSSSSSSGAVGPTLGSSGASSSSSGSDTLPSASPGSDGTAEPRDCSPAVQSDNSLGTIDVTRLGCACPSNGSCPTGEICVTFTGLDTPRCSKVEDACELITCPGGADECVDYGTADQAPWCYP